MNKELHKSFMTIDDPLWNIPKSAIHIPLKSIAELLFRSRIALLKGYKMLLYHQHHQQQQHIGVCKKTVSVLGKHIHEGQKEAEKSTFEILEQGNRPCSVFQCFSKHDKNNDTNTSELNRLSTWELPIILLMKGTKSKGLSSSPLRDINTAYCWKNHNPLLPQKQKNPKPSKINISKK